MSPCKYSPLIEVAAAVMISLICVAIIWGIGAFRKHLDKISILNQTTPIVYKNSIFVFSKDHLITVLPIAQRFHKYIKRTE